MNIALAIMKLYPSADPTRDFIVQDDNDGKGPYIADWNLPDIQPTPEQLQVVWDQIKDAPAPLSEIDQLKAENESLRQENAKISTDFQGFMDYFFTKFPE